MNPITKLLRSRSLLGLALLPLLLGAGACVTEKENGEMVPRGNQRYPWDKVKQLAENLQDGMTKSQVLNLLGSPAETDEKGDVWVYLPERYAILVPAQALRLEFKGPVLVEHGYRAIVLGTRL